MHAETSNREAFERVTAALECIEKYKRNRELTNLVTAEKELERALELDRDYQSAVFYSGIVKDLIGKPVEAVPFFRRLLRGVAPGERRLRDEAEYNLAVAYYHQYSHRHLENAEKHFWEVLARSDDQALKALSRAGLTQTYAMWMIPSYDQKEKLKIDSPAGKEEVEAHIRDKYLRFEEQEVLVEKAEKELAAAGEEAAETLRILRGTLANARGMALMYFTDYLMPDREARIQRLRESIESLEAAADDLPEDWANTSDMASAHMRLGLQLEGPEREREFVRASNLLHRVVESLRPGYGFALYELGRLYRAWGRFEQAAEYLWRAGQVPEPYRDISSQGVEAQMLRVRRQDKTFP